MSDWDRDHPMPPGVEAMTKQQLWNWVSRSQQAFAELSNQRRSYFEMTSGLHGAHAAQQLPALQQTVELQRQKIAGLSRQMAQMNKGYQRKIKRLETRLLSVTAK